MSAVLETTLGLDDVDPTATTAAPPRFMGRIGLATRMTVLTGVVALVAVTASLGAVAVSLRQDVEAQMRTHLDRAAITACVLLSEESSHVEAASLALAASPRVQLAMAEVSVDKSPLMHLAEELALAMHADALILTDASGRSRGAFPPRLELPTQVFQAVMNGKSSSSLLVDEVVTVLADQVMMVAGRPVMVDGNTVGFVVVAQQLSTAFLSRLRDLAQVEASVLVDGKIRGSTVHSVAGAALSNLARAMTGQSTELVLDDVAVMVQPQALGAGVKLVLLTNVDEALRAFRSTQWLLALVGLLSCLFAIVLGRVVARPLTRRVLELADAVALVADGNLARTATWDAPADAAAASDEIDHLRHGFSNLRHSLWSILTDLRGTAVQLRGAAHSMGGLAGRQSQQTRHQAHGIAETNQALEKMAVTSKKSAERAQQVLAQTRRSAHESAEGLAALAQSARMMTRVQDHAHAFTQRMQGLQETITNMDRVMDVVNQLAYQSHALAMRPVAAGAPSKLDEPAETALRSLVARFRDSAGEVRTALMQLQQQVRGGIAMARDGERLTSAALEQAETAGSAIQTLEDVIKRSGTLASSIAEQARDQALGIRRVSDASGRITEATERVLAGTQDLQRMSGLFETLSGSLDGMLGKYRL